MTADRRRSGMFIIQPSIDAAGRETGKQIIPASPRPESLSEDAMADVTFCEDLMTSKLLYNDNDDTDQVFQPPKEKQKKSKRRYSADLATVTTGNLFANITDSPSPERLALPSARRSRRLKRKSIELCRSAVKSNSQAEVIETEVQESESSEPIARSSLDRGNTVAAPYSPGPAGDAPGIGNSLDLDSSLNSIVVLGTSDRTASKTSDLSNIGDQAKLGPKTDGKIVSEPSTNTARSGAKKSGVKSKRRKSVGDTTDGNQVPTPGKMAAAKELGRPKRKSAMAAKELIAEYSKDDLLKEIAAMSLPEDPKPEVITNPTIEDIYLNKLWRQQMPPETRMWETIYEEPSYDIDGEEKVMDSEPVSRVLSYDNFHSWDRLKRRRQLAIKSGYRPSTAKKRKGLSPKLHAKLRRLDKDLNADLSCSLFDSNKSKGNTSAGKKNATLAKKGKKNPRSGESNKARLAAVLEDVMDGDDGNDSTNGKCEDKKISIAEKPNEHEDGIENYRTNMASFSDASFSLGSKQECPDVDYAMAKQDHVENGCSAGGETYILDSLQVGSPDSNVTPQYNGTQACSAAGDAATRLGSNEQVPGATKAAIHGTHQLPADAKVANDEKRSETGQKTQQLGFGKSALFTESLSQTSKAQKLQQQSRNLVAPRGATASKMMDSKEHCPGSSQQKKKPEFIDRKHTKIVCKLPIAQKCDEQTKSKPLLSLDTAFVASPQIPESEVSLTVKSTVGEQVINTNGALAAIPKPRKIPSVLKLSYNPSMLDQSDNALFTPPQPLKPTSLCTTQKSTMAPCSPPTEVINCSIAESDDAASPLSSLPHLSTRKIRDFNKNVCNNFSPEMPNLMSTQQDRKSLSPLI